MTKGKRDKLLEVPLPKGPSMRRPHGKSVAVCEASATLSYAHSTGNDVFDRDRTNSPRVYSRLLSTRTGSPSSVSQAPGEHVADDGGQDPYVNVKQARAWM